MGRRVFLFPFFHPILYGAAKVPSSYIIGAAPFVSRGEWPVSGIDLSRSAKRGFRWDGRGHHQSWEGSVIIQRVIRESVRSGLRASNKWAITTASATNKKHAICSPEEGMAKSRGFGQRRDVPGIKKSTSTIGRMEEKHEENCPMWESGTAEQPLPWPMKRAKHQAF